MTTAEDSSISFLRKVIHTPSSTTGDRNDASKMSSSRSSIKLKFILLACAIASDVELWLDDGLLSDLGTCTTPSAPSVVVVVVLDPPRLC